MIAQRLPLQLEEDRVAALRAGLLARHEASLADLASALDIAIPAVRENLERVAERLRPEPCSDRHCVLEIQDRQGVQPRYL